MSPFPYTVCVDQINVLYPITSFNYVSGFVLLFILAIQPKFVTLVHVTACYTPGIYAEGYIVFVFPFVRSYVRSFVCSFVRSFVRSYFLPSRGICVKVLR